MLLKENLDTLNHYQNALSVIISSRSNTEKEVENLIALRMALNEFQHIDALKEEVISIKENIPTLFNSGSDKLFLPVGLVTYLENQLSVIRLKISAILQFWKEIIVEKEDALEIKLPEVQTFSDLEREVKNLKVAIEFTLNTLHTQHELKIVAAQPGSIWLEITLGSMAAIGVIGSICKKAAQISIEVSKAKMHQEYLKSIKLNNEMITHVMETAKTSTNLILEDLAKKILEETNQNATPELTNQLKLSISTFSELMDKGAKFLPQSKDKAIQDSFPDIKVLSSIVGLMKKIENKE